MDEKTEKEFTVRDRRTFASPDEKEKKADAEPSSAGVSGEERAERQEEAVPPQEIDFMSFILSLVASAQVSLGYMPNPQTNKTEQALPVAKQMIEIIGMLKEKTKGNLNDQEQMMVDNALFNLRMQYVKAVEGKK